MKIKSINGGSNLLKLQEINKDNWINVILLCSGEDQQNRIFEKTIASNCLSIAQASIDDQWITRAIYDEDQLIGFTMYGHSDELKGYELCRLMIDYHFQGKGYGKTALELIVEEMKKQTTDSKILVCFQPDNEHAKKLYERFGFKDTGRTIKGNVDELVYSFTFER